MPQYLDSSCSCPQEDYSAFNSINRQELALPITAEEIVNQSAFCTSFQLDAISLADESLTLRDYLFGLKGKIGVYHIWVEEDYCYEHQCYSMLGVYVGKGDGLVRILMHAREKLPSSELFGVSFFECENRIAKYLEQLFLDSYKFHLNEYENPGTRNLYARWDEDRRLMGTELHNVANRPNAPRGD